MDAGCPELWMQDARREKVAQGIDVQAYYQSFNVITAGGGGNGVVTGHSQGAEESRRARAGIQHWTPLL